MEQNEPCEKIMNIVSTHLIGHKMNIKNILRKHSLLSLCRYTYNVLMSVAGVRASSDVAAAAAKDEDEEEKNWNCGTQ